MPPKKNQNFSSYQDDDDDGNHNEGEDYESKRRCRRTYSRRRSHGQKENPTPRVEIEQPMLLLTSPSPPMQLQVMEDRQLIIHDQEPIIISSDSNRSETDAEDFDELMLLLRDELRNSVQCPVCLGIIKNTRVMMECQHRFCKECIDKSIRLGKKECPTCRIRCPSRRSLRDDPNFDALIQALFPDADKYVEEELVLHEEEKTLNEQFQTSIQQVFERQAKALPSRRKLGKREEAASASAPRMSGNSSRRRRNTWSAVAVQQSDQTEQKSSREVQCRKRWKQKEDGADGYKKDSAEFARGKKNGNDSTGRAVVPLLKKAGLFSWGKTGVRSH